jgi:excisionase family DNA binding protein
MKKPTTRRPKVATPTVDLDALLGPEEAASWLGVTKATLLKMVRRKKVPVLKLNERVYRFHPKSILAARGAKV